MSSSPRALPIELIEEIFSYLFEVDGSSEVLERNSRRHLRSCALSCHAFFRPAIRFLWHNVCTMWLLKLLPGFHLVNNFYLLTGQLSNDSLKRFDLYCSMVKTIVVPENRQVIDPVYTSLALARPRPLPSLTRVVCLAEFLSPIMIFMISPSLKSVLFDWVDGGDLMKYLALVKKEAPMLDSLTIIRAVGKLDLVRVTQLPNLRVLDLSTRKLEMRTRVRSSPSSLKRLDLRESLYDWEDIIGIIQSYLKSELESFSLQGEMPRENLEGIFRALSSQWPCTLTSLTLQLDIRRLVVERNLITVQIHHLSDFLSPLYPLKNVKVLRLSFSASDAGSWHNTCITDAVISDICKAWPNLSSLNVSSARFDNLPTVASFNTLSTCCPNLSQVSIPFDIPYSAPFTDHNEHDVSYLPTNCHKLECITLLVKLEETLLPDLFANGCPSLAHQLDMAFPYLKKVSIQACFRRGPTSWDKVVDVIRLRQDARRLQRLGTNTGTAMSHFTTAS